jgi:aryl-alcohol dehydrogenase-like predicted oxidoreductase
LASGLLSGKYGPDGEGPQQGTRRVAFDFPPVDKARAWQCVDTMREIAKAHDKSVAQVALAWILAKPFVTSIIIGARTLAQLDDNLAATSVTLSAEEIQVLDDISKLPPEYPGWMLEVQDLERLPKLRI